MSEIVTATARISMDNMYLDIYDMVSSADRIIVINATVLYVTFTRDLLSNGYDLPKDIIQKLFMILSELSIINIGAYKIPLPTDYKNSVYLDSISEELEVFSKDSPYYDILTDTKIIEFLYGHIPEYDMPIAGMAIEDYSQLYIPVRWMYSQTQIIVHVIAA